MFPLLLTSALLTSSMGLWVGIRAFSDTKGWRRDLGQGYEYIVVNGAGYQKSDEYELTVRGLDRVEGALRLYQDSPDARFILCGGDIYGEGAKLKQKMG